MKQMKKILAVASLAFFAALVLVACGQKTGDTASGKEKVILATVGTTKPFSYEVDGELTGYDIEVARAIFEGSDKYEIAFQKTEWSSIFAGLDSDKFAMGANNLSYSEERAEKYLYSLPIATNPLILAVNKDSGIKRYEDIAGKSTQVVQGTATAAMMETYNKENPSQPVDINFTNENIAQMLLNVDNGKYDFKIFETQSIKTIVADQGLDNIELIEMPTDSSSNPYVYLLLAQGQDDLRDFVDKRIKELAADGTLEELSQKFLGGSFLPEELK